MKKIPFWKMSGSGNDFVAIDNRRKVISGSLAAWARRLCDRHEGVGADGLLLLEPAKKADFRMTYFNSDGSRASMCGNGARCISWMAHRLGAVGKKFDFETDAGLVHGEILGKNVRVTLGDPRDFRAAFSVRAGAKKYRVLFINTGVPHAVVPVRDVGAVDILAEGRRLRFHPAFGPQGANVNFIQRLSGRRLKVRTYERGVEGETLACGTGVCASAVAAALEGWVRPAVQCQTAGGDVLEIDFKLRPQDPRHPAGGVSLRGPVRLAFVGEIRR